MGRGIRRRHTHSDGGRVSGTHFCQPDHLRGTWWNSPPRRRHSLTTVATLLLAERYHGQIQLNNVLLSTTLSFWKERISIIYAKKENVSRLGFIEKIKFKLDLQPGLLCVPQKDHLEETMISLIYQHQSYFQSLAHQELCPPHERRSGPMDYLI